MKSKIIYNESLKKIARVGYATKGILYILIGTLALQTALGMGGEISGLKGVLNNVIFPPFGKVLLFILALGLIAHAAWRFMQAIFDPQEKGNELMPLLERAGFVSSVFVYGGLAYSALRLVFAGNISGGDSAQQYTGTVLSLPFGKYIVILAGIVIIASGIFQGVLAVTGKFKEKFDLDSMNSKEIFWTDKVSRFGLAARSIVFMMLGAFLIQAAIEFSAKEAGGLELALKEILQQDYGPILLVIIAAGLISYGGFTIILAWYHKFYSQ